MERGAPERQFLYLCGYSSFPATQSSVSLVGLLLRLEIGFPRINVETCFISCAKGHTIFESLDTIDYGSNVPLTEEFDPMFHDFDKMNGYPPNDLDQFMAWFHMPSILSISIWLRRFQGVIT